MDRRSQPGSETTTLEAVGNQWCYALAVVQAGEEEKEESVTAFELCCSKKLIHLIKITHATDYNISLVIIYMAHNIV